MGSQSPERVLAVDLSADGCRLPGILASAEGGRVHVEVAFVVESEADMWAEVVERMGADRRLRLAVGATLEVHVPRDLVKRTTVFGSAELGKWTGLVRPLIVGGLVSHDGSRQLADQVNRAVAVRARDAGQVLSSVRSPGPIEMARCMVVAVALASKPPRQRRVQSPAIGVARV